MRSLAFFLSLLFAVGAWSQTNVELSARYKKDNQNYIYMESKTETIKLKKSELTQEGVEQILKNKDKDLILFVPEASIVNRSPKLEDEQ